MSLSAGRDVVGGGVDVELLALGEHLAGQRVELGDALDLVAEELDPDDVVVRTPAGAPGCRRGRGIGRATERLVVALVLQVDELAQDAVAAVAAAGAQPHTVAP